METAFNWNQMHRMKFAHGELISIFALVKKRNAYKHVRLHRGFESFHPFLGVHLNMQCSAVSRQTQIRFQWSILVNVIELKHVIIE